jgi:hypothetical protein
MCGPSCHRLDGFASCAFCKWVVLGAAIEREPADPVEDSDEQADLRAAEYAGERQSEMDRRVRE